MGSLAMKLFSWNYFNRHLTNAVLEEVYGGAINPNTKIVLNNGWIYTNRIEVKDILDFPLISKANDQFGCHGSWDMMKGAIGDFSGLLEFCTEDVVVVAHSHEKRASREKGKYGKSVILANPGCWNDQGHENVCIVEIEAPWHGRPKGNGVVQLIHLKKPDESIEEFDFTLVDL